MKGWFLYALLLFFFIYIEADVEQFVDTKLCNEQVLQTCPKS